MLEVVLLEEKSARKLEGVINKKLIEMAQEGYELVGYQYNQHHDLKIKRDESLLMNDELNEEVGEVDVFDYEQRHRHVALLKFKMKETVKLHHVIIREADSVRQLRGEIKRRTQGLTLLDASYDYYLGEFKDKPRNRHVAFLLID